MSTNEKAPQLATNIFAKTKPLTASLSSSTDHDSSELLWDDEFNRDDNDLFGADRSDEGDYDEDNFGGGGGGVYGCVGSMHCTGVG